jgi:PAS domain S-box-containing protein
MNMLHRPARAAASTGARLAGRYLLAVAVAAVAWLLSYPLAPYVDPGEFPLFLGAVMLSAWYGGLGPGLLTTAMGALVGVQALVTISGAVSPSVATRLAVFVAEALVICVLGSALRGAEARAQALAAGEQAARATAEAAARRLHDLQRITDSALSHLQLDALLDELIARVRDALHADTVVILLLDEAGQELVVRAAHGLEEEVRQGVRIPLGQGIAGRIATGDSPVLVEDIDSADVSSPVLRTKGLRSLLGAPLTVAGRLVGVVHVGTLTERRFTPENAHLLGLVADRIATAIERSRLFEAEQRARGEAERAERRFRLLVDGVQDYAFYVLDPTGRIDSWNAGAERFSGYAAEDVLGQHVEVLYAPEDAHQGVPRRTLARAATEGQAAGHGWRVRKDGSRFWAEVLVTALRDDAGQLVGYGVVAHDLTERQRAAEVRTRLLEQVIAAQEEEQRRIARELHDETGQSLTSLLVGLRALEEAASLDDARAGAGELRTMTARALDEVRRLARGLRPSALDELGLLPAIEQYALDSGQARGLAVDVRAHGFDGGRLPSTVETAVYRIVQEALTNVVKHARARSVSVVLRHRAGAVQAIVADDGCGFDVEAALRGPGAWAGLGLHGMRERAALLGGEVTIESAPGEGTTIYVCVPAPGDEDAKDQDPARG